MSVLRSVRLLDDEAAALEALSNERNITANALIRIGVRALVGLPNPSWAQAVIEGSTTVSTTTREG